MTITLDIRPEIEAEVRRQAASRGVDFKGYAASALEDAAGLVPLSKEMTAEQLEITLNDLAQFSSKIPLLPDQAFSRESLYRDQD